VKFCEALTTREIAAGRLPKGLVYQLPTEAQWEYACRAGTTSSYSFGDDASRLGEYAWFDANAWDIDEKYAHRVGTKRENAWHLYDMHGNLWEWCRDWYEEKLPGGRAPLVSTVGSFRVFRGGSWYSSPQGCRSAFRFWDTPSCRSFGLGFRVSSSVK
jgi:formylglycine-generating enzyme required for sulfatase activity